MKTKTKFLLLYVSTGRPMGLFDSREEAREWAEYYDEPGVPRGLYEVWPFVIQESK